MKRKHRNQVVKPKSRQLEIWKRNNPAFLAMQELSMAIHEAAIREQRFMIKEIHS